MVVVGNPRTAIVGISKQDCMEAGLMATMLPKADL